MGQSPTSQQMLTGLLRSHSRAIFSRIPGARADDNDAVHQLRTGIRRLRNIVAAFDRHLRQDRTSALQEDLKEFGYRLSQARDLEVRAALTAEVCDGLDVPLQLSNRLLAEIGTRHRAAHQEWTVWSTEFLPPIVTAIDEFAERPPVTTRIRSGTKLAADIVDSEAKRTSRAMREIDPAALRSADAEALHAAHHARRAGRRLRHVVEALTDVLSKKHRELARHGANLQSLLGQHRDLILLAVDAHTNAERATEHNQETRTTWLAVADACELRAARRLAELTESWPG